MHENTDRTFANAVVPPACPIQRLIGLIRAFEPFLDSFGHAHCRLPARNPSARTTWKLEDPPVRDVLLVLHRAAFGTLPTSRDIDQALALIRGELWLARSKAPVNLRPGTRLILAAAATRESWVGSASELLTVLSQLDRDTDTLAPNEELPSIPDALGIELSKCALELRGRGIELFRPRRRDKKRLWAWRALSPDADTSAAFMTVRLTEPSSPQRPNGPLLGANDTSDTLSEPSTD